jgi:hypothetical protein
MDREQRLRGALDGGFAGFAFWAVGGVAASTPDGRQFALDADTLFAHILPLFLTVDNRLIIKTELAWPLSEIVLTSDTAGSKEDLDRKEREVPSAFACPPKRAFVLVLKRRHNLIFATALDRYVSAP